MSPLHFRKYHITWCFCIRVPCIRVLYVQLSLSVERNKKKNENKTESENKNKNEQFKINK